MNVLLVDDINFVRYMCKDALTPHGFVIAGEADDGTKAVEEYKRLRPELVIMDVAMPFKDGITAMKLIREFDPGAKVIILSEVSTASMAAKAFLAGARDFVCKPFQTERLLRAARESHQEKPLNRGKLEEMIATNEYGGDALNQDELDELVRGFFDSGASLSAENKDILAKVDHTLLTTTATTADFIRLCDEGVKYGVASVCVPPSRVEMCARHVEGRIPVCTVVGFPNGYALPLVKAFEAEAAIKLGAAEIDMVIDIGRVKEKDFIAILEDIKAVREAAEGYILKVIIETSLLDRDEKRALCSIVNESGADFIKTSTGFAGGGATFEDVELLRKHVKPHVKVKASGGISTLEDAKRFIELGADRLGTSRIVKIIQGLEGSGY